MSNDLAHWRRVANALDPSFDSSYDWHDGDCDGTVSFVPAAVADGGVVMSFGPDCARSVGPTGERGSVSCHRRSDPPHAHVPRGASAAQSSSLHMCKTISPLPPPPSNLKTVTAVAGVG